jgi:hypothetical protein
VRASRHAPSKVKDAVQLPLSSWRSPNSNGPRVCC